jgi:excinuclease ABC subunit C
MDNSKRKTLKRSSLEKVDGIGPAKAKAILAHFKTISALKDASIEDIEKVNGIGNKDAVKIFEFFREN